MKQLVALDINSDGLFIVPRAYIKTTTFKPNERLAVTFAAKYIMVIPASRRHYGASYYTYLLDNGSMYLKNINWNSPGVYELQIIGKKKIRIIPAKL